MNTASGARMNRAKKKREKWREGGGKGGRRGKLGSENRAGEGSGDEVGGEDSFIELSLYCYIALYPLSRVPLKGYIIY